MFLPGESHDRGASWTTAYGVTKSWTWLSRLYNSFNRYELFSLDKLKSNIYLNRVSFFLNLIYDLIIRALVYIIHFIKILKRKYIFLEPDYSKCNPAIFPWEIVGYSFIETMNVSFTKISRQRDIHIKVWHILIQRIVLLYSSLPC